MKKLLFTGGHHNGAVSLIDWLVKKDRDISYVWVGRKMSAEYKDVTSRNVKFYNLIAGKLFRARSILYLHKIIWNLLLIPVGCLMSLVILIIEKPALIISFGGYLALPVVFMGKLLGIPAVTHEQTTTIGLANKLIYRFVNKVYVSWPVKFYPSNYRNKMVFTGLALRNVLTETKDKFVFNNNDPVIYVTGGKSGSAVINNYIFNNIDELTEKCNIIWSVGASNTDNDVCIYENAITNLSKHKSTKVVLREYFKEDEIGRVFNTFDLAISRGGAHVIYELLALERPAIIIPIPWSSSNEQSKNADYFKESGLGIVIDQESTSDAEFLEIVFNTLTSLNKFKLRNSSYKVVMNGQEKLGNEILSIIK